MTGFKVIMSTRKVHFSLLWRKIYICEGLSHELQTANIKKECISTKKGLKILKEGRQTTQTEYFFWVIYIIDNLRVFPDVFICSSSGCNLSFPFLSVRIRLDTKDLAQLVSTL